MYFPKASISLNIAETTFVITAIKDFIASKGDDISTDYLNSMIVLANDCESMWSNKEWEYYSQMYYIGDLSNKHEINHNEFWTLSIVDCDAVILAMQMLYVCASKDAIEGIERADNVANALKNILIPRFANMFSKNEWDYYNKLIDEN